MISSSLPLVLGSSSPYRKELLTKLGLTFTCDSPDIDESSKPNEDPAELSARLALGKARMVATRNNQHLIIASDQVASLGGTFLSKPGNADNAFMQLRAASNNTVYFYTSLCLFNSATGQHQQAMDITSVTFKNLKDEQIKRYIEIEEPFNCAGSFKSEGLGVVLFETLKTEDPNALIGLPLIKLTKMLEKEGINLPL